MKLCGIAHDFLEKPLEYQVTDSVLTKDRVAIDWTEMDGAKCNVVAYSHDGGSTYRGNYGDPLPKASWTMELTRYTAMNKEILLVGQWVVSENGNTGVIMFKLKPVKSSV